MRPKPDIGLGTVQLGLPYGNRAHAPLMNKSEANEILETAVAHGIRFFDTAIAYGESEERIGAYELARKVGREAISTKIPVANEGLWRNLENYWSWLRGQVSESSTRLRIDQHHLLQFHQCDIAFLNHLNSNGIFERLISDGICKEIGISVYTMEQAQAALEIPGLSALQIPANIVDTRFLQRDFIKKCQLKGIKLIVRSVFLQGILIAGAPLPTVKKQTELKILKEMLRVASAEIEGHPSLEQIAIRYLLANNQENVDILLIGVDSIGSLRHNLALIKSAEAPISKKDITKFEAARGYAIDTGLLNPANWNL